jgi:hypothetical protein
MRLADEEDGVKEAPLRIKDDVSVSPEPPCGLEVGIAVCPHSKSPGLRAES